MAKLYFVLLLFLLGSCAIEEAQPQNDAKLIIAQDFLSKAQKKVLVKIAKRREIDLSIRDLSAKEIRNILRKNPWEPGGHPDLTTDVAPSRDGLGVPGREPPPPRRQAAPRGGRHFYLNLGGIPWGALVKTHPPGLYRTCPIGELTP